jgi:tetratricopeptide (TPR) repeat protein
MEQYPNNPFLPVNAMRALAALGRIDEARSLLLDHPGDPPVHWVAAGEDAWILSLELASHGHTEAAREVHEWALEWFESLLPEQIAEPLYRHGHARSLYATGRWEEADSLFKELARQMTDSVSYRGYQGSIAARSGDRELAQQISESLETLQRPYRFGAIEYWQARIAAVLGDSAAAFEKLQQAFNEGFQFSDFVLRDEDLLEVRGYEPIEELLRPKG